MTTTLTAPGARATQRPHAWPVTLVEVRLTVPSALTLRASDQYVQALGYDWLPYLRDVGAIEAVMSVVDVTGKPRQGSLTWWNTRPIEGTGKASLTAMMRPAVGGYEFLHAEVTVILCLATAEDEHGAATFEEIRREVFYLEEPTDITPELVTFPMSDKSFLIETKCRLCRIDRTTFRDAAPSVIGQRTPVYFGGTPSAPSYWVQAGGFSRLAAALPFGGAAPFAVNDTESFPTQGAFNVQIEDEVIKCNGAANGVVTIVARAQAGTRAALHPSGAGVWELRPTYLAVVAENPRGAGDGAGLAFFHRSIKDIYSSKYPGLRISHGFDIDMDNRGLVPGRSFVTIRFPGAEKFPVTPAPPPPTSPPGERVTTVTRTANNTPVTGSATWKTGALSATAIATATLPALGVAGTVRTVRYTLTYSVSWAAIGSKANGGGWLLSRTGPGAGVIAGDPALPPAGAREISFNAQSYESVGLSFSASFGTPIGFPGTNAVRIHKLEAVVEVAVRDTPPPPSGPGKTSEPAEETAAEIMWGTLSCDIVGLEDDAAGTITGARLSLITGPAWVTKCALLALYPKTKPTDFRASFAATAAKLAAAGIVWAGRIDGLIPFSQLRRKLGEQARSVLHLEGGQWDFPYLEHNPVTVATLDSDTALLDGSVRISKTAITDIINSLHVFALPDNRRSSGKDRYRYSKVVEDLAYPIQFPAGSTEENDRFQRDLELDWIQDPFVAAAIGTFWLTELKRQRVLVDGVSWHNVLALDNYDAVAVTNDPVLAAWPIAGYRIVGRRHQLDAENPGRIGLVLKEADA